MKCLRESVAERSGIETARPAIVFTLGFNLTLNTLGTGRHEFQISWIVNQQLDTEIHGAGCGLDRVWIGLDPGLDRPRPRIGPTFLCMLHRGCSVTRKGRQGEQAASGQLGSLDLQQLQLDCLTAWQRGLATRQLGCLTA